MDNNTGIEQFDQALRNTIVSHIELKRYITLPEEIKKINEELRYLVKCQSDLMIEKDEYISNNDVRPSEVPIYFDIFIDGLEKKRDYLFDEKFKIWMEHLYNIKTYNIFEIYKYDLYTARTTPLDHKKIRANLDRLRISISQEN